MNHPALVRAIAITALALCLCVVVLGAYVRLSNAGLGCPDWPGCYGHLTPAGAAADAHTRAAPLAVHALNVGKAWREMVHRYAAGTLALLIVGLALATAIWRRERILASGYAWALAAVVILQAVLGALTVTQQLKPLIVTSHLLFGFTTLSLLWWLVLTIWWHGRRNAAAAGSTGPGSDPARLRIARAAALTGLCILGIQIALGGWTSSNYAAIACPDLPTCQGSWWPKADFRSAYVLWRGLNIDYEGGVLANPARVAIHLTHRVGAIGVTLALLIAAVLASRVDGGRARMAAWLLLAALGLQLAIGVTMVWRGFPLWIATAHNAGAALLLLATLSLYKSLR